MYLGTVLAYQHSKTVNLNRTGPTDPMQYSIWQYVVSPSSIIVVVPQVEDRLNYGLWNFDIDVFENLLCFQIVPHTIALGK